MFGRITVVLFALLLVWGNLVAGMKAGLACPDWPLCQGKVLPPLRLDVWMEFTHRMIAACATIALLILAWRRFRAYRGPSRLVPVAAVGLIAGEIVLGGMVVVLELPVQLTTVHFMIGLAIFFLVLVMARFDGDKEPPRFPVSGYAPLFVLLGALVFAQAALGAYVRHAGAGLACPDFPTCLGQWLPPLYDTRLAIHIFHRLVGIVILTTLAVLAVAATRDTWLRERRAPVTALLLLCLIQIGIGAGVVLSGLHYLATALHLATALGMLGLLFQLWSAKPAFQEAGR